VKTVKDMQREKRKEMMKLLSLASTEKNYPFCIQPEVSGAIDAVDSFLFHPLLLEKIGGLNPASEKVTTNRAMQGARKFSSARLLSTK
jgi:hypothetical protein